MKGVREMIIKNVSWISKSTECLLEIENVFHGWNCLSNYQNVRKYKMYIGNKNWIAESKNRISVNRKPISEIENRI